jgi:hypothetical protein
LAGQLIGPTIYNMVGTKTSRSPREPADHQRIRLLLLDDHVLFRESLARLLASENDFELVAECNTAADALKRLKNQEADVTLVDAGIAKDFIPCARSAANSAVKVHPEFSWRRTLQRAWS